MYEPNPAYLEKSLEELEMTSCKPVISPGVTTSSPTSESDMSTKYTDTMYRRITARLNFLSQDRPDITFSVNKIAQKMAHPESSDWVSVKRVLRDLKGRPRRGFLYRWQHKPSKMLTYSDSDWAACPKSRRSTTGGGCLFWRAPSKALDKITVQYFPLFGRSRAVRSQSCSRGVSGLTTAST